MPRTTLDDRARKARIAEREIMRMRRQYASIESLNEADFDALRKIVERVKAAQEKGAPLTTEAVTNWRELRAMGVIRADRSGAIMVSAIGKEVIEVED